MPYLVSGVKDALHLRDGVLDRHLGGHGEAALKQTQQQQQQQQQDVSKGYGRLANGQQSTIQ
jgi:hypothetical protein